MARSSTLCVVRLSSRVLPLLLACLALSCWPSDPAGNPDGRRAEAGGDLGPQGDSSSGGLKLTLNGGEGYVTVKPGAVVTFAATAPSCAGCTYAWDFGNGQTGTGAAPSAVTYATKGLYRPKVTMSAGGKVSGTAAGVVTVWEGTLSDDFERADLGWDSFFWLKPADAKSTVGIQSGALRITHALEAIYPGAVFASPQVKDLHAEVILRRQQDKASNHYAVVYLRLHPTKRTGYYLRIKEDSSTNGDQLELALFRVTDPQNEGGTGVLASPPWLGNFDPQRKKNLKVTIDVADDSQGAPLFLVRVFDAAKPLLPLIVVGVKDSDKAAIGGQAGFVGLSQAGGEVLFDSFLLKDATTAFQNNTVPDAGVPPEAGIPFSDGGIPLITPQLYTNGDPTSTHGFVNVAPSGKVSFTGIAPCPTIFGCTFGWDFGNATTGTGANPAAVTYGAKGVYHVGLTLKDVYGDVLGKAAGTVADWDGTISDDFERATIDHDARLWLPPMNPKSLWTISGGWLRVTHTLQIPGSTALLSAPLVKNFHVEVVVKRNTDDTQVHYCDVIVRMHPQKKNGSFYRVRMMEQPASNSNELDMSIFKIITDQDEHGIDITPAPTVQPNFDPTRKKNVKISIDVTNDATGMPIFDITFSEADTGVVILQQLKMKDKDAAHPPHSYAGFVGLTQFAGVTDFNNYVLKQLP